MVAKNDKKGAKGQFAAMKHSLSLTTTKGEIVALLKDINDRKLFEMFLRSQRKILENKGLVNEFVKMDVKKFEELMKFTLATHSDWAKWKGGLFDMSRDYAGIPALWHVAYERLYTLEGTWPPPWVRDWLDTTMDPGLLTKGKAEVCRLVEAKLAELAGKDGTDGGQGRGCGSSAGGRGTSRGGAHAGAHVLSAGHCCDTFRDRQGERSRKEGVLSR